MRAMRTAAACRSRTWISSGTDMTRTLVFAAALLCALPVAAKPLQIDSVDLPSLHLEGSQCDFARQNSTVLASDWVDKLWMKIDGKMVEFTSTQTDTEIEQRLASKRWRETLKANGITVMLNLTETGRGDDSAAYRGCIEVERNGVTKRLPVTGGCAA
jgi:hypothetical protein